MEKIKPVSKKNKPVSKNETDLKIEPQHIQVLYMYILGLFSCRKKTSCELNEKRKVEPSPQYGRKNLAFENAHDSLTREETGSIPDKQTGILIYNKEVFYSKEDMGKNEQENPPV